MPRRTRRPGQFNVEAVKSWKKRYTYQELKIAKIQAGRHLARPDGILPSKHNKSSKNLVQ